jgi:hypothetical protein
MVNYICERCNKQFIIKCVYITHINRKYPCKKVEPPNDSKLTPNDSKLTPNDSKLTPNDSKLTPNDSKLTPNDSKLIHINIEKEYTCNYCNKVFSKNSNIYRHIKVSCKVKKQDDSEKEQIYQQLLNEHLNIKNENKDIKNENETIKNKLTELEKKLSTNKTTNKTTNNNTKNINNGIIQNIQIVAHGKEDLSKIKENVIIQLVKRGWRSIPMFTEYLHCNNKFPEQKNIYINDINRKYCMVYNGYEWLLKDKTETIDELYQTKYDFLEENFNTYYDQLEDYQQRSFQKFIKLHKEDAPFVKKIKEELKTLLYNKRNKILNNSQT